MLPAGRKPPALRVAAAGDLRCSGTGLERSVLQPALGVAQLGPLSPPVTLPAKKLTVPGERTLLPLLLPTVLARPLPSC